MNGAWGDWDEWTSCSQTCTNKRPGDIAKRTRTRSCSNPVPSFGGEDCKGYFDDAELCNQDIPCGKFCVIYKLNYVESKLSRLYLSNETLNPDHLFFFKHLIVHGMLGVSGHIVLDLVMPEQGNEAVTN